MPSRTPAIADPFLTALVKEGCWAWFTNQSTSFGDREGEGGGGVCSWRIYDNVIICYNVQDHPVFVINLWCIQCIKKIWPVWKCVFCVCLCVCVCLHTQAHALSSMMNGTDADYYRCACSALSFDSKPFPSVVQLLSPTLLAVTWTLSNQEKAETILLCNLVKER